MNQAIRQLSQRMRLRKPQQEALALLDRLLEVLPMSTGSDPNETLKEVQKIFPSIKDFERDFPNFCFALATGVGKTRLMGAMIAYLAKTKGIQDFVILAPNTTIAEKLIREFSPGHPKYIFSGIPEFANQCPRIITADNFDEGYGVRNSWAQQPNLFNTEEIHINIFNIAMIHSADRRMKKNRETIVNNLSYFEYLTKIDNLVVFMDEAHRYRAVSGSKAINDLKPILGVELTATPQIETKGQTLDFKNILYHYPLSFALRDGFVKDPQVGGRQNFDLNDYDKEALEKLKIEDGIRIHEHTKIHIQNYAYENRRPLIKPFILIIAENTTHAEAIKNLIKSSEIFEGKYSDKVEVVHSSLKADEEEEVVKALLQIESPESKTEIVIHVNMLKEGWDVVNLYTIVPLRAANSKTLIEQSIGRGLRLPYGQRTGVKEVDSLTIVSHDRFDDLVKEARKESSIIRSGILIGRDVPLEGIKNTEIRPSLIDAIEGYTEKEKVIANATLEILKASSDDSDVVMLVCEKLKGRYANEEITLFSNEFINNHDKISIKIPRIIVQPAVIKPGRYRHFDLNVNAFNLQPSNGVILKKGLVDGAISQIITDLPVKLEEPPIDFIARNLLEMNAVLEAEENEKIVIHLSTQLVNHLSTYLKSEKELNDVVASHISVIVKYIFSQMQKHFEEPEYRFQTKVNSNFIFLESQFHVSEKILPFEMPPERKSQISSYLFTGFKKSTYSSAKFDSDSERCFACILEQDPFVLKWVRPPRNSFKLYYHADLGYEPDFIVESQIGLYLCEIKSSAELDDPKVKQKAEAAVHWCAVATDHAREHNTKPWRYLLIPHNEARQTMSFHGLAEKFTVYST